MSRLNHCRVLAITAAVLFASLQAATASPQPASAEERSAQAERLAATFVPNTLVEELRKYMRSKLPASDADRVINEFKPPAIKKKLAEHFSAKYTVDELKQIADLRENFAREVQEISAATLQASQLAGQMLVSGTAIDAAKIPLLVAELPAEGASDTAGKRRYESQRLVEATVSVARMLDALKIAQSLPQFKNLTEDQRQAVRNIMRKGDIRPEMMREIKTAHERVFAHMLGSVPEALCRFRDVPDGSQVLERRRTPKHPAPCRPKRDQSRRR